MSEFKIDREHFKQTAKELGIDVVFDSDTPGVNYVDEYGNTVRHLSFEEVLEPFLGIQKEDN